MSMLGVHLLALANDWRPCEAAGIAERLSSHGVSLLELPLLRPDAIDCTTTRSVVAKQDLEITFSLCLPIELDAVKRTEEAFDFLKHALAVADKAGSKTLTGVTYTSLGKLTGNSPQQFELDALCRLLEGAGKEAGKRGMRLGVEVVNRYETHLFNTATQAKELLERIGAANLFIHLDTYHMNIEEAGIGQGMVAAGELLGYVHLSESNRGVPGTGTVDWADTFAGMQQSGFTGPAVVESFVHMDEELARGVAIWRPVAKDPDAVIDEGLPYLKAKAKESGYAFG